MADPVQQFLDAMIRAGIRPVESIADKLVSGAPVRFRADGDRPGRRNGWAKLHLDGVPAGVFRHYRLGIRIVWRAQGDPHNMTSAERRARIAGAHKGAARRNLETLVKQEAAAGNARDLWSTASEADPTHEYLVRKSLPPLGILQHGTALLVPMVDSELRLWNVQRIYRNGRKLFLSGGRTNGLFWHYSIVCDDGARLGGPWVIGEGFATMAAIHVATGFGVIAAMSAHNLQTVALRMRKLFPEQEIIIAADDDSHLPENPGLSAARQAAQAIGAPLANPTQGGRLGDRGVDFADIPRDEARARIDAARPQMWQP